MQLLQKFLNIVEVKDVRCLNDNFWKPNRGEEIGDGIALKPKGKGNGEGMKTAPGLPQKRKSLFFWKLDTQSKK